MIVTLDGQRVATQPGSTDLALQDVIDHARATCPPERLIVAVRVNGAHLSDEELADRLSHAVDEADQIDLESEPADHVVREAFLSLGDRLGEAGANLETVAERLAGGDVPGAMREIADFVTFWQQCHRAITQGSELLGKDLTRSVHDGRSVDEWLGELVARLSELRSALESHDMVLLADLVRYELPPLCASWKALLGTLAGPPVH